MKKTRLTVTKMAILTIAFFSFIACDDDFKEIGGDLVGNNNFDALRYKNTSLSAHSKKIKRIQSNDLSSYALGVYNDEKYGTTSANILAQIKLASTNPEFGDNPVLDSVVLEVPYFSTVVEQDPVKKTYELDSVFGEDPVKLSLYRSNYFLRQYDPNEDYKDQAYYSDDIGKIEENMDNTPIYTTTFMPSKEEIVLSDGSDEEGEEDAEEVEDTTRLSPRLRLKLPKEYFQELILDREGEDALLSNENFQDFFRGLYFKSEQMGDSGVFSLLDFDSEDAGITLYFRSEKEKEEDDDKTKYNYSLFNLEFDGQMVNVFDNDVEELPTDEENLYVKGGQGAMTVIDLFTDDDQLDSLRNTDWLINEANLKLYVNEEDLPVGYDHPQRLFIYDVKNKRVLIDYEMSASVREDDVLNSRTTHLGRLSKDDEGNHYYKMRVTNYVNDIINKDATNTRLGLVVSQNVNDDEMVRSVMKDSSKVSRLPRSSVLSRNGTVFYGPKAFSDKALKLEIHYTKPE